MEKNIYLIEYDKEINDTVQKFIFDNKEANRKFFEEIKDLEPSQFNKHIENYLFKDYLTTIKVNDKHHLETLLNYYQKVYYSIEVFEVIFDQNKNIVNLLTTIKNDIAERKIKYIKNKFNVIVKENNKNKLKKLLNDIIEEEKSKNVKNEENEAIEDRKLINEASRFFSEFQKNVTRIDIYESNLNDYLNLNIIQFTLSYLCELDEIPIICGYYLNRMIAIEKYVKIDQIQCDNNLSQIVNNKKQAEKRKHAITNKAFFTLTQNIN